MAELVLSSANATARLNRAEVATWRVAAE